MSPGRVKERGRLVGKVGEISCVLVLSRIHQPKRGGSRVSRSCKVLNGNHLVEFCDSSIMWRGVCVSH